MHLVGAVVIAVALLIGVPLVIVGLSLAGSVGWIVAAVVLPVATLAAILLVGREPPDGRDDRQ